MLRSLWHPVLVPGAMSTVALSPLTKLSTENQPAATA